MRYAMARRTTACLGAVVAALVLMSVLQNACQYPLLTSPYNATVVQERNAEEKQWTGKGLTPEANHLDVPLFKTALLEVGSVAARAYSQWCANIFDVQGARMPL